MIVNDKDALKRLDSPMNLINCLRQSKEDNPRKSAMSLFIPSPSPSATRKEEKKILSPFETEKESLLSQDKEETSIDTIIANHDSQIKLGLAHDRALDLLSSSINLLSAKLDDVKADKLPAVISAASKTVESIRRERLEQAKSGKDTETHYHFYVPEQRKVSDYSVIDVGGTATQ